MDFLGFVFFVEYSKEDASHFQAFGNQGRHDRTCKRAREGHSRSLKSANEQKIFVDKLPFPSCLAQLLARISLRDVRNLC